jgi:hypothetical protein
MEHKKNILANTPYYARSSNTNICEGGQDFGRSRSRNLSSNMPQEFIVLFIIFFKSQLIPTFTESKDSNCLFYILRK